jgi:lipopolysaccharide export system permease protein
MRIIDRYLLRQFLQVFVICFVSLTGLYVVFDAFTNLDEFMRYAEKSGSLWGSLAQFYGYRTIFFFDRMSGILAMISAMFTLTWIQRYNELTALMAAGVSKARVALPVGIAAVAISLCAAANRELVIPGLRDELSRSAKDLSGDSAREFRPRYDHRTDVLLRGKSTITSEQRIVRPSFLLPPELAEFGNQLDAESAKYVPAAGDRPSGYLLSGVVRPEGLDARPSIPAEKPVLLTHQGAPQWVAPGECLVVSEVTFEQLAGGGAWRQFSSTADLVRGLRNPSLDFGADVRVAIHARVTQPLLDLTLLVLGLPLVLRRETGNIFLAIGLCAGLVGTFLLISMGAQHLGSIYLLDPALAAWLPLLLFVPLAAAMSDALWQ